MISQTVGGAGVVIGCREISDGTVGLDTDEVPEDLEGDEIVGGGQIDQLGSQLCALGCQARAFEDIWTRDPHAIPADIRATYLAASRNAVASIVADYRASAHIDVEHDRIDRAAGTVLRMPVSVLQQDWGAALGFDARSLWRAWAPDLHHETVTCGHFMAEESPAEVTKALRDLLNRQ